MKALNGYNVSRETVPEWDSIYIPLIIVLK